MARNTVVALLLAGALLSPSAMSSLAMASSTPPSSAVETSVRDQDNALETRQYRIEDARLPGEGSVRQTVTAWQITSGTWNGVSLEGLSVVVVQSRSEDRGRRATNCYISHTASVEQREALLQAFMTTQPQFFSAPQMERMRIEPATITIDVEGTTVTLHVGLIA